MNWMQRIHRPTAKSSVLMKATNGLDLPLSLADLLRYRLAPLGSGGAEVRIRRRVTNQRQVKFATDSLLREVDFELPVPRQMAKASRQLRDARSTCGRQPPGVLV